MKVTNFFIRELGFSPNEYNNRVIDAGFQWIRDKSGSDVERRNALSKSSLFWDWWWCAWNSRNEKLYLSVIAYYDSEDKDWLRKEFAKIHTQPKVKESQLFHLIND